MDSSVIALIGADGQLGTDLAEILAPDTLRPLYYPAFDLTRPAEAAAALRRLKPGIVINTAAFNRVDECEARLEDAFRLNAFAVRDLARTCADLGAVLVHFSTDYVFDGRKGSPYSEEDEPRPLNAYGESKLAGEHFVRAEGGEHFLIRTCGLFGRAGCLDKGRNFIQTMVWLAGLGKPIRVVSDQIVAPTSTRELAANVAALIRSRAFGLYHMTSQGECSWYEFARAIFDISGLAADLGPIATARDRAKAQRPAYSVLGSVRTAALGLPGFSHWRDALSGYLEATRAAGDRA